MPKGIPDFKRFIITPEINFISFICDVSFSIIEAIIIASFLFLKGNSFDRSFQALSRISFCISDIFFKISLRESPF